MSDEEMRKVSRQDIQLVRGEQLRLISILNI
jgi:hypothetical protein